MFKSYRIIAEDLLILLDDNHSEYGGAAYSMADDTNRKSGACSPDNEYFIQILILYQDFDPIGIIQKMCSFLVIQLYSDIRVGSNHMLRGPQIQVVFVALIIEFVTTIYLF